MCVDALTRAGLEAGLSMTVVCPDDGPLGPALRAAGADWVPLAMRRSPHPGDLGPLIALRRLVTAPSVVHLHSSKAGALGRIAVRRRGGPTVVYTPHGWGWLVGGALAPAYRLVERGLAGRADAIVAVSEDDRAAGAAVLGTRSDRLQVIPNGVDTTRFTPDGPVAERTVDPLAVCVGRLCRAKGQDLALEAVRRSAVPNLRLRLLGDGPDRPALEERARRLGIADRVEFAGAVDDPSPHLRAADVVVVPSRWDAQSLSLLEAMSTGRPVVATAVSGTAALGDGGAVVPVGDPSALAEALDRLLVDPEAGDHLGAANRRTALEHHRVDQMTATTIELWRTLARPG